MENATIREIFLPFTILISPIKAFSQLAQRPAAKGLISVSALVLIAAAAAQYASATKIIIEINGEPTSFVATDLFVTWLTNIFLSTSFSILLYWLVLASGLALISRTFGGKQISWRVLYVSFGYLLSVFMVLYAVRAVVYLTLPSLYFENVSSWPPLDQVQVDYALNLMAENWGSNYVYQFGSFFTLVAFVWLVVLGAIAVKTIREISWRKAAAVSIIGFSITLFLFGFP